MKIIPGKAGTVPLSKLNNLSMVAGYEKRVHKVIHNGVLKEWVGIGWVTLEHEKPDPDKHPVAD